MIKTESKSDFNDTQIYVKALQEELHLNVKVFFERQLADIPEADESAHGIHGTPQ